MSKENKNPLASFMKKQISEKSSKKIAEAKSINFAKNTKAKKDGKKNGEEEMSEEEKLAEAKKNSQSKAATRNQTEMLKKLFLENLVKYSVIISVMVIFSIGIVKFGGAIIAFFNGLIFKIFMSAIGK